MEELSLILRLKKTAEAFTSTALMAIPCTTLRANDHIYT